MYYTNVAFSELIGKTINQIDNNEDELVFFCEDGSEYRQIHHQDCCESVSIEDIVGDLDDLLNTPILHASEDCNSSTGEYGDSCTWTFYNISTIKGSVTIRWYGSSNGYYSESVDFERIREPNKMG